MENETRFPPLKTVPRTLEEWETYLAASPKRSKDRTEAKIASMRMRPPGAARIETFAGAQSLVAGAGLERPVLTR